MANEGSSMMLTCYPDVPMKPMVRSQRRFHRQRMIRHARSILIGHPQAEELQRWAEKRHDYLSRCGSRCYFCRNKRKKFGPTIQERRLLQDDAYAEVSA